MLEALLPNIASKNTASAVSKHVASTNVTLQNIDEPCKIKNRVAARSTAF